MVYGVFVNMGNKRHENAVNIQSTQLLLWNCFKIMNVFDSKTSIQYLLEQLRSHEITYYSTID